MSDKNEKNSSYISGKESRRISKFNRRVTKKLERDRADANKDPALFTTKMKDENNVVEFDNVCTYFFTDVGTVKAVDGVSFVVPKCSTAARSASTSATAPHITSSTPRLQKCRRFAATRYP